MGIKCVIEKLTQRWSWDALQKSQYRGVLVKDRGYVDKGLVVYAGKLSFKMRHRKEDGDFRIWTNTASALIQWRTCPKKGNRLIYRPYGKGSGTERLAMEDIFLDPWNVDEGEVQLFEMMYPEFVPIVPLFEEALQAADDKLFEGVDLGIL